MSSEPDPPDPSEVPSELDEGLAFAYGEDSVDSASPSVLRRIAKISGSKPQVLLREEGAGDTPMLKPLGPDDRVEAGKYVVQGELGRGGVGTVHKGHDQDLGRDVAMKFLHERYRDEPAILHRFVEEAQIGGQLQHPGIVPVYDLGMADGKPFFAMKLVKGQTLAKKLADRTSPSSDRRRFLAIFENVCQTLAYAHARGVIHRDLKPANIMIGNFGEVQVVDWGMGKVLASGGVADEQLAARRQADRSVIETVRSGGHGSKSMVGSVMGTPAYMPPEQARGDVEAMDERSDVFALGALLCEILTGQPPYVGEPEEIIGMAAMAKLDAAHSRLEACGAEQAMVELATRCLMPAPAARPKSAEVVAKAVHGHLAAVESRVHEARVEAAEAKVRAAALKRTQMLGAGLTVVIAAGLVASLWFWRAAEEAAENEGLAKLAALAFAQEAQESEELAVDQTKSAERELARALEIKTLITEMLESVDPELAKTADITLLKGILDTASQRLTEGAIEDELVAAELHALTGKVYLSIGRFAEAEQHLPAAFELRKRALGEEHRHTLVSMNNLALLHDRQGSFAKAEPIYLQALEIMKRVLGEEDPTSLKGLVNLANLHVSQGRYAEAESLYLRALELWKRATDEEHPCTLGTMSNLAGIYLKQGRFAEAEALHLQVMEIMKRVQGEEGPASLQNTYNLALLYFSQGRFAEAEPLILQALEYWKRLLGEEHPTTLMGMGNLATLYAMQGRHAEAEPLLLQALEVMTRVLGEEHPDTLGIMATLANLRLLQNRYSAAEPLYVDALEIQKRLLGEEHPTTLGTMGNLAALYAMQGRHAEAESLLLHTLVVTKRVLGEEHPDTLVLTATLADQYLIEGRYAEAEVLYSPALKVVKRVLGEEHPNTLAMITNIGKLYNAMGRFEDAAEMLELSLPIKRRVLGLQHPWTGNALNGLVTAYTELGRAEDALPLQRDRLGLRVAPANKLGASAEELHDAACALLMNEVESLRDPEQALSFAVRACELAEESGSEQLWAVLDTLALAQHETGDSAAAFETQKRAVALMPEGANPEVVERLAEYEAAAEGGP